MGMVVVTFLAANADGVICDHDQIDLKTNQVRRKLRQSLRFSSEYRYSMVMFLSFNVAKLAQLLPECLDTGGPRLAEAC